VTPTSAPASAAAAALLPLPPRLLLPLLLLLPLPPTTPQSPRLAASWTALHARSDWWPVRLQTSPL
jgi:hypothetical protein